ncbi:MAG: AAA family ATPase [Parabacteroides sp.]
MLIRRIRISNYKTYLALDLDLSVSPERPIVLIGGMNGGGKTTLFEAICGALYGLKIKSKEQFGELLNNGAVGRVAPAIELEISFDGQVLGQTQRYLLRRTYKLNPAGKPVESVSLNMNGNQFVYGTAMPLQQRMQSEQQVNKIIKANLPEELSQYFLFDAMQSSELLKEQVFAQIIKDNIQNVMGFNKYLQLKQVAEHLQQEWAKRRLEAQQEAEDYNKLCEQRNALLALEEQNLQEQDRLYKHLVTIEAAYQSAKEGEKNETELKRKIGELETAVSETDRLCKRYNEELKSFVDSMELNVFYPKLMAGMANEIHEIVRQKELLRQERNAIISETQLRELTQRLLGYLKERLLCPAEVEEEALVDYLLTQQEQHASQDRFGFLDETELEALKDLLKANAVNAFLRLNSVRYDLGKRLENYDNQKQQIELLRGSLTGGNEEIIRTYEEIKRQRHLRRFL